jgi:hypothetical protein
LFWFSAGLGGAYGPSESLLDPIEKRRFAQRAARSFVTTEQSRLLGITATPPRLHHSLNNAK